MQSKLPMHLSPTLPSPDESRNAVPITRNDEREMPHARRRIDRDVRYRRKCSAVEEKIPMPKIAIDENTAKLVRRLYPQADRLSRARYYQLVKKVRAEMARDTNESGAVQTQVKTTTG